MTNSAPFSRALLHAVASLHYEQALSQREIAKQLKLSTATVSRLIQRARDEGVVRIEISEFLESGALEEELESALKLKRVIIVPSAPESGAMAALAEPTGRMLRDAKMKPRSVLGLGWGRTIWEVVQVGLPNCHGITTVALSGGIPEAAKHFQIGEIIRLAAVQTGGTPRFIHAPFLLSEAARSALIKDPVIKKSVELWSRIDVALVGIGRPHGGDRTSGAASMTPNDPRLDQAAGDVLQHYFDINGQIVPWKGQEKMLAISLEQLRRIPLLIGLVASPLKAVSIIGAARGGLINALVTDTRTAARVLDCLSEGNATSDNKQRKSRRY